MTAHGLRPIEDDRIQDDLPPRHEPNEHLRNGLRCFGGPMAFLVNRVPRSIHPLSPRCCKGMRPSFLPCGPGVPLVRLTRALDYPLHEGLGIDAAEAATDVGVEEDNPGAPVLPFARVPLIPYLV
jgi:hypothetical protein